MRGVGGQALFVMVLVISPRLAHADWVHYEYAQNCSDAEVTSLQSVNGWVDKAIVDTDAYVARMTGTQVTSAGYLYWYGGWVGNGPGVIRTSDIQFVSKTASSIVAYDCHSKDKQCDGTVDAFVDFINPTIHLCEEFWTFTMVRDLGPDTIVHEMGHMFLGFVDAVTSLADARNLVLSGSVQNQGPWQIALTCSYNWQGFEMNALRPAGGSGGCSINAGPVRTLVKEAQWILMPWILALGLLQRRRR